MLAVMSTAFRWLSPTKINGSTLSPKLEGPVPPIDVYINPAFCFLTSPLHLLSSVRGLKELLEKLDVPE
jgi:hypothetical protein